MHDRTSLFNDEIGADLAHDEPIDVPRVQDLQAWQFVPQEGIAISLRRVVVERRNVGHVAVLGDVERDANHSTGG